MNDETIQKTPITKEDWIRGKKNAPVTILEYGDFECPYCGMAYPELEAVQEEALDAVRLVYRHFPLTTVHPNALPAAEAAEAAGAQGKFWEMHDMLFTHQEALEYENLLSYAEAIGLDADRFDDEMERHVYRDKVRRHFRQGVQDGVNGTPTLFFNRIRYDGPRDRVSMLAAVAAILEAEQGRKRAA
ncbi:MAG TPA: DsbA family protein [Candidatus Manganitrophaceae bacterium]|nr:DsbA family protein [Candidatus Manganitrophaceae bacterium]